MLRSSCPVSKPVAEAFVIFLARLNPATTDPYSPLQLGEASRLNRNTYKRMVDVRLVLDHMSGHLGLGKVELVTGSTGENWVTMS